MSSLNDNFKKLYLEKMQYFFYNYNNKFYIKNKPNNICSICLDEVKYKTRINCC